MPLIPCQRVVSCSSEDRSYRAENLLKPENYKKWISGKDANGQIECIIEFEKPTLISSIDVGNDGSAFIELFVSRSNTDDPKQWTVFLPSTLLMTPSESRSNLNRNQVKLLKSTDFIPTCLKEKWTRVKIICEQKFNQMHQFGLCFIKFYSPQNSDDETTTSDQSTNTKNVQQRRIDDDDDETGKAQSKIGSFFAKKQAEKSIHASVESTPSDQIRALSNVAEQLLSNKSMDDLEIQQLLKKNLKNSSHEASKRRLSEEPKPMETPTNSKRTKVTDKSRLMKNVVFVLSGFKNPLRSELRQKATTMGATYSDDWDEKCTHLICAFPDTPKFTQVQKTGYGSIVNSNWILDCYQQNQLLSEKNYELTSKKTATPQRRSIKTMQISDEDEEQENKKRQKTKKPVTTFDDDDDDDDEMEQSTTSRSTRSSTRKSQTKKPIATFDDDDDEVEDDEGVDTNIYDAETDDDDDQESENKKKPSKLSDFFQDKHFYIYPNEFDKNTFHDIRRIIYAYNGTLEKQVNADVNYIITNQSWTNDFDDAIKINPTVKFLTLEWLQDCHDENKLVPIKPYLITSEKEN